MDWDSLAEWWQREAVEDPSYRSDVLPMVDRLLEGAGGPLLDLGCGEGSTTAHIATDVTTFGCDESLALLRLAARRVPAVRCRLPDLGWVRAAALGGAFAVYVLDLVEDAGTFFAETARVVRAGGVLVVIVNHPIFTAPGSGPFHDDDFEVMWRWGRYFEPAPSPTMAGGTPITMYHHPTGELLDLAAAAGWSLERFEERGLGFEAIAAEPGFLGQESMPRFLGMRWRRTPLAVSALSS